MLSVAHRKGIDDSWRNTTAQVAAEDAGLRSTSTSSDDTSKVTNVEEAHETRKEPGGVAGG